MNIKAGAIVRLKPAVRRRLGSPPDGLENHPTAKVVSLLDDIAGGLHLDRPLYGFRFWNTADVDVIGRV